MIYMPLLMPVPSQVLKSEGLSPPTVFSFFNIVLSILGPLHFHLSIKSAYQFFFKKPAGILVEIVLNL